MTQTDFLIWMTSLQTPLLNQLAALFTFIGNEAFYFLIIPFIYWCLSKSAGFRLLYIFLLSIYVNAFLKIHTAFPRPVGIDGIQSLFVESAQVGSHYPLDSFPSGHAQGSTTLWGYLAYQMKNGWFWVLAVFLIVSISFSRLYTGLHWPVDVLGGIAIAIIILVVAIRLEKVIMDLPPILHWMLALATPIVMAFFLQAPEGVKYAGFLFGAGIGYLLEKEHVQMDVKARVRNRAAAFMIGMTGIVLLQMGLPFVLPEMGITDFAHYALIGLWGMWIAPWLFVKLGIYDRDDGNRIFRRPPLSV